MGSAPHGQDDVQVGLADESVGVQVARQCVAGCESHDVDIVEPPVTGGTRPH